MAIQSKKKFRTELIRVRVTAEERAKFEKLAASKHTDISQLTRQLLHREADQAAA
jgi:hypothetical protein